MQFQLSTTGMRQENNKDKASELIMPCSANTY